MSNEKHTIKAAIQRIAAQGHINWKTNRLRNVGQTYGYVDKIHYDEDGNLTGLIDVKEFAIQTYETQEEAEEANAKEVALHKNVRLSALDGNTEGYLVVPKLHSEVTIGLDADGVTEYVIMMSHIDILQLDSHEKVFIGVREREPYDVHDDKDVNDLDFTNNKAWTEYTKGAMKTTVVNGSEDKRASIQHITIDSIHQSTENSSQDLDTNHIALTHKDASIALDGSKSKIAKGSSSVIVEDGTVYVGSKSAEDAVLGNALASVLSELITLLETMLTPTSIGPQATTNMAAFKALKTKIQSYSAAHNGFLTPKVKIQKN